MDRILSSWSMTRVMRITLNSISKLHKALKTFRSIVLMSFLDRILIIQSVIYSMQLQRAISHLGIWRFKLWHLNKLKPSNIIRSMLPRFGLKKNSHWFQSEEWLWTEIQATISQKLNKSHLLHRIWFQVWKRY